MIRHTSPEAVAHKRLRELTELRSRVDTEIVVLRNRLDPSAPDSVVPPTRWSREQYAAEIARTRARLERLLELAPTRRSRNVRPDCGTETGYQHHRYRWRRFKEGPWPLPDDDPCGCRAAHTRHWHAQKEREELEGAA